MYEVMSVHVNPDTNGSRGSSAQPTAVKIVRLALQTMHSLATGIIQLCFKSDIGAERKFDVLADGRPRVQSSLTSLTLTQ
jgi:hypothetical protein